jgi:hypothetical protein
MQARLGKGTTRRPGPTAPADELSLAGHPRVRPVRREQPARQPIVPGNEGLASIPHEKTGAVHGSVGEAPERIRLVRDEVRRDERVLTGADGMSAQGAVGAPARDPLHPETSHPPPDAPTG